MMFKKQCTMMLGCYAQFGRIVSFAHSPFFLVVRLYWGSQFVQTW